jgi:hypothetical protein
LAGWEDASLARFSGCSSRLLGLTVFFFMASGFTPRTRGLRRFGEAADASEDAPEDPAAAAVAVAAVAVAGDATALGGRSNRRMAALSLAESSPAPALAVLAPPTAALEASDGASRTVTLRFKKTMGRPASLRSFSRSLTSWTAAMIGPGTSSILMRPPPPPKPSAPTPAGRALETTLLDTTMPLESRGRWCLAILKSEAIGGLPVPGTLDFGA